MKSDQKKHIHSRAIIVGVIFSLFFTTIAAQAVYLQICCGSRLSQKAANQYVKSFTSSGKRGVIFDANLGELAVSINMTSIAAHPLQIVDQQLAVNNLARILDMDKAVLQRKLSSKNKFVWIKRHVAPKQTREAHDLEISGLDFIAEHKRFYPNKTLAAQVLGFTDIDDNGLEGIEFYYDNYLKGGAENFTILKDALGRRFDAAEQLNLDHSGNNVILTIDRSLQYFAEKTLQETVTEFAAKSGIAIVMVPKTGALLALAHYPFFNPNAFSSFSREVWRNRSITDPFEPGSTLKIFSAAAAIESGSSASNSLFYCENGEYRIGNEIVHDTHPYGWLSLQQIIKHSSNIGAVKLSEITGPESLYKTLREFGFGSKTRIECPGETAGTLAPYKRWAKIDAGTIAFGQGISVSAMQLITATAAIANNGILMKPNIVQAITDQNGRLIESFGPQKVRRVVSSATAQTINRILRTVITSGGTGVKAALDGYSVCGKTGTAQKIDERGTYAEEKYTTSFVGFAPAEKPEVAVLVVIDEPRKGHYGGIVAAPAFKKIAEKTLHHLNVPPTKETDRLFVSLENEA